MSASRKHGTAPRSLLLALIGRLVCKWKGGHKWRRVKGSGMEEWQQYSPECNGLVTIMAEHTPAHNVCTRCGTTRPIKTRAKRVVTGNVTVTEARGIVAIEIDNSNPAPVSNGNIKTVTEWTASDTIVPDASRSGM